MNPSNGRPSVPNGNGRASHADAAEPNGTGYYSNERRVEVAVAGSPNTVTEVQFDVRDTHLQSPLLGSLLTMRVPVHGHRGREELLVLGQVSGIETQNRWHEDPSLKNYIKLHGNLPHLTEIGDTTTGHLQIVGAYREALRLGKIVYQKTRLSVPPGSGLKIYQVDRPLIEKIMEGEFGYGYLGNFYGTLDVPAPVLVRHFGPFDQMGSGEAYMGGVFGPSGSGKSVVAASLIAMWAHNPQMGLLILDPQSEFSANDFGTGTGFDFDFHELLVRFSGGRFKPRQHIVSLDELCLEGAEMFVQVLVEKGFFKTLGVSKQKEADAAEYATQLLGELEKQKLWETIMDWDQVGRLEVQLHARAQVPFPELFTRQIANAYAIKSREDYAVKFHESWHGTNFNLSHIWNDTVRFFSPIDRQGRTRLSVLKVLQDTVINGKIRILDLNPQRIQMSQRFKLYLMDFVFRKLRQISHMHYRDGQKDANCLIVLDEAGRFIPQHAGHDEMVRPPCKVLTDRTKELRKMRGGFLFITQTLAEIQKEIFRNLHFRIYGVGLGVGSDADHIRAREGDDAFELYRSLPDPRLSGTYSFMIAGVLIALGSSGRPMVIEGFSSGRALLEANGHIALPIKEPTLAGIEELEVRP